MTSGTNRDELQRLRDDAGKLPIDDERLRFAVVERKGERGGVEPGVERVENRPAHRHAIMAFEHRWGVGEHDRHGIAADEPPLGQCGGEHLRACVEFAIVAAKRSMRNRQPIGEHLRGALEKRQRRQRLEVRGVAVEIAFVR